MSSTAIGFGLFILFAVAFVGGLGQPLYTYAGCVSAVCLVLAGLASNTAQVRRAASWLLVVAAAAYDLYAFVSLLAKAWRGSPVRGAGRLTMHAPNQALPSAMTPCAARISR